MAKNPNKRLIPSLAEKMKQKQATSNKLAERAGVGRGTVHSVRHGKPIDSFLADCIEKALEQFDYKYLPRGRSYGAPYRGRA